MILFGLALLLTQLLVSYEAWKRQNEFVSRFGYETRSKRVSSNFYLICYGNAEDPGGNAEDTSILTQETQAVFSTVAI